MFITQNEKDMPLLHQMIPLGAVELRKKKAPLYNSFQDLMLPLGRILK